MKAFKFLILLGKSGSGKGTQAELLQKYSRFERVSSGVLLRKRAQKKDFVGKHIKQIMARGGLAPTPLVFHMWLHELEKIRKKKNSKGVILEGSPRKLYEAWMLQEALEFYGWGEMKAVHLNISDKEAFKRLLLRARPDDKVQAVKERLKWFRTEVKPVIAFYKRQGLLVEVDGERSIKTIHKDMVRKLERFLK